MMILPLCSFFLLLFYSAFFFFPLIIGIFPKKYSGTFAERAFSLWPVPDLCGGKVFHENI
ncbi:MAG TPA: hypothetical protein DD433_07535 [Ruminococcaceae bacterium]|nr:hypothetical protein [Oscillospiraceae bacterium]